VPVWAKLKLATRREARKMSNGFGIEKLLV
jgi:hypothetical protein